MYTRTSDNTHHIASNQRRRPSRVALGAGATIMAFGILLLAATGAEARRASHVSWAPELARKIVPTRAEGHGMQVATWYGPGFFGNGTACGQTLTEQSWGIAHRTLPCGTLVTLSHKGRKVTVRVIDRGPYSGATVDLTARTKSYLRFKSGRVRMTEVKRFRVLPHRPIVGTFAASSG